METLKKTPLYGRHASLGATLVPFAGWHMPLHYRPGIVQEHLATRRHAGLFDVSHMGRFTVSGKEALAFLQHVLTNNAAALDVEESQYTLISDPYGHAIDDAYLYRFEKDRYLLVVNAANTQRDRAHFQEVLSAFEDVSLQDHTESLSMLSLQGPRSKTVLADLLEGGRLPEPLRNALSTAVIAGAPVQISRTGYTGEPLCFELFMPRQAAQQVWDGILSKGAFPVGLGARDTLRLEAGLPLFGHEFGTDPEGNAIPVFACPLARFAVSFSPLKGDFIGRAALEKQFDAFKRITFNDFSGTKHLPRRIHPMALMEKGVPRQGFPVFKKGGLVGYVTSGTMVPYHLFSKEGIDGQPTGQTALRGICLALVNSDCRQGDILEMDIRGRRAKGILVPYHLRSEAPPFARPVPWNRIHQDKKPPPEAPSIEKALALTQQALYNTRWRRQACINLIPSEQTPSSLVKYLSMADPSGRYAEHKALPAFSETEVFYYQGTDFIAQVESLLKEELCAYLGCREVEPRVISGQMANTAVFSAMVDHLNCADRKHEQRRMRKVLHHHIIKGGHLSAQPMGALRDFVMRDPRTEKPAVVPFPVMPHDPFRIDVEACRQVLEEHRPELIVFGKSMTLYREPVAAIREMVKAMGLDCTILYDMAHVLGLVGPHFQEPFKEGADIVTGSTHKTFFGTQRGLIACDWAREDPGFALWEAVVRRTFPGSTSNHHLGTLLGLLMAAYEMNHFKEPYQRQVLANAKAFARALADCGLHVAGDPDISHTETHQVVLYVGYAQGPEIARRLEESNIIVNYQAAPTDEGFTAAGALRMGVQEMTRFGMKEAHFQQVAQFLSDVVKGKPSVKEAVAAFRKDFLEMAYTFPPERFDGLLTRLSRLL